MLWILEFGRCWREPNFLSPVKPLYSNWREENWAFAKADFDPLVHHLDQQPDVDHDGGGDVSDT